MQAPVSSTVAGFVGVGTLADKMVRGFCSSKTHLFDTIYLSPRNAERARALAELYEKVVICSSNQEVLDKCLNGVVFLAVRPQDMDSVCSALTFSSSHLVISVIASKNHEHLVPLVSPAKEIVLAIPMPPIEKGIGPTIVFPPHEKVKQIFDTVGKAVEVDSLHNMRALMTATCMMAPYYGILGQMISWTAAKGVDPKSAGIYITSLIEALHSDTHEAAKGGDCLEKLIYDCQTPGGINEQSLLQLKDAGFFEDIDAAMDGILARLEGRIELPKIKKVEETPVASQKPLCCQNMKHLIGLGLAVGAIALGVFMSKGTR